MRKTRFCRKQVPIHINVNCSFTNLFQDIHPRCFQMGRKRYREYLKNRYLFIIYQPLIRKCRVEKKKMISYLRLIKIHRVPLLPAIFILHLRCIFRGINSAERLNLTQVTSRSGSRVDRARVNNCVIGDLAVLSFSGRVSPPTSPTLYLYMYLRGDIQTPARVYPSLSFCSYCLYLGLLLV